MRVQRRSQAGLVCLPAWLLGLAACGTNEAAVVEPSAIATVAVTAASVIPPQIIDLGTLPGGTSSAARAINNLGQIVGTSNDPTLTGNKQVIWAGGTVTPISAGTTNALPALHQAINDAREIVSWFNNGPAAPMGVLSNGIYWNSTGASFVLPSLPGGENRVFAYDINQTGLIVGESRDAGGIDRHAIAWNRTAFSRDLGLMGAGNLLMGNETSARGTNDLGDVVGRALIGTTFKGFLWRNGVYTDLGPGEAVDINNSGLVVGNSNPEVYLPWVWQNGVRTDLPPIAGRPGNYLVSGLNNTGDVVGWGPGVVPSSFGAYVAVIWRAGQAIELGNFPGGTLSRALGINDLGQVVGEGNLVAGGPMHALLWSTNTAPAVALAATSSLSIKKGGKVTVLGAFTDPDAGPWTYTFNWGNGTTSGTALTSPGAIPATRTYTKRGLYQVSFTVTDAKLARSTSGTLTVQVR